VVSSIESEGLDVDILGQGLTPELERKILERIKLNPDSEAASIRGG
jgi:hypothetical protein